MRNGVRHDRRHRCLKRCAVVVGVNVHYIPCIPNPIIVSLVLTGVPGGGAVLPPGAVVAAVSGAEDAQQDQVVPAPQEVLS